MDPAAETVSKASALRGGEVKQQCPPAWPEKVLAGPTKGFRREKPDGLSVFGFQVIPPKVRIFEEKRYDLNCDAYSNFIILNIKFYAQFE